MQWYWLMLILNWMTYMVKSHSRKSMVTSQNILDLGAGIVLSLSKVLFTTESNPHFKKLMLYNRILWWTYYLLWTYLQWTGNSSLNLMSFMFYFRVVEFAYNGKVTNLFINNIFVFVSFRFVHPSQWPSQKISVVRDAHIVKQK